MTPDIKTPSTHRPGRHRMGIAAALLAVFALLAVACGGATPSASDLKATDRYVHVQATELDARRTLDQDPFPQKTLDEFPEYFGDDGRGGAGGYYLFMTDEEEWRIGSYIFLPQELTLVQGDRIVMEILGVRGSEHETVLTGPGLDQQSFTVKRGELHRIEFTVDEPGRYQLMCITHQPTMTMDILVLPSDG